MTVKTIPNQAVQIKRGPGAAAPPQVYGEVFTKQWVVEVLLDLVGYTVDRDLGSLTLVEPSAGSGAFLLPAIDRLMHSAAQNGHGPTTLRTSIRAWEVQPTHARALRKSIKGLLTQHGVSASDGTKLANSWVKDGDFLLPARRDTVRADVVIGNPPYIRLEDLPRDVSAAYRSAWPTMGGRADIYVGFIERSLSMLKPGGRVGFICADRWMRNQYGDRLRQLVATSYAVEHIWVMHDVDAFEEQVSAYPAITVLRNAPQGAAIAADTTCDFTDKPAKQLVRWATKTSESFSAVGVKAHRLPTWFPGDESWPTGSPARLRLVEELRERFQPLHDPSLGTKVSIGVASGADRIFVTKDASLVESDRLLPLAMVKDLAAGEFKWSGHYLVDPWTTSGQLVDLEDYPRLRTYLNGMAAGLRSRHVAKKAEHNWYRTIDKVHSDLTDRPKLLLPDMHPVIHPVLESGGHYPHHNLYYVISDTWDLEVLGGLLLSKIAQAFIEAYCVRMRGGTLRFQAQYLKRIRVPDPVALDHDVAEALRTAFLERDQHAATQTAAIAYGIDLKEYDLA